MAIAETAKLVAALELKDNFTPAANKAMKSLGRLESTSFRVGQNIGKGFKNAAANLAKIGAVAGGVLAVGIVAGIDSLSQLEDATTSVDAAIKQVGLTGKLTSEQIAGWANDIEASVGAAFDDKQITAAAATLLRFGSVTADNLHPALVVMTDLAAKTGDIESAATLLARALADPTKAAGKLARQGIILTAAQQKQIAAFVKAGKVGKAQGVILDALAQKTAGAAKASQGPFKEAMSTLKDVTEDAERALAIGFLPVLQKVAGLLKGELAKPQTIANIKSFGQALAAGLDKLITVAQNLPWGAIGDSLRIAGAGAKAVLDAFLGLPAWVQTAVITGWGLNKLTGGALSGIVGELASGLIKGVLGITAGVVNINAATVGGGSGLPGVGGAAAGGGLLATAASVAVPVTIAAIATTAATQLANADLASKGIDKSFAVPGSSGSNPLFAVLPFGIGASLENIATSAGIIANYAPQTAASTTNLTGDIESLRGVIAQQAKSADVAAAILSAGAQRDAETSSSIATIVDQQAKASDIEELRGKIAAGLDTVNTSTIVEGGAMSQAARNAGVMASNAAYGGAYIVAGAVAANRPITNVTVNVSATTVQKTVDVITRYGPSGGDRDSDGGGGPGQG